jgi:hypothetical protein
MKHLLPAEAGTNLASKLETGEQKILVMYWNIISIRMDKSY